MRSANTEALRFAALLNPISEQWQQEHIQKVLTPLFAKGENLRSTLVSWFEHNCDVDKTAIALFVQPNTVRYRLRLAEECTGLTLSHFQARGLLYAALTIRPSSQWIVRSNKK